MTMLSRRNFLRNSAGLLVAAPFVVKSSILMPVKPTDPTWSASGFILSEYNSLLDSYKRVMNERVGQILANELYDICQRPSLMRRLILNHDRSLDVILDNPRAITWG